MMELKLTLGFVCCGCEDGVTVTVQWREDNLRDQDLRAVSVPCPHCGTNNRLSFESNGTVRSVRPCICYRTLLEPSVN